ncbi:MAG: hypothetical protein AAF543_15290 [Pseudomonadota bacterium]
MNGSIRGQSFKKRGEESTALDPFIHALGIKVHQPVAKVQAAAVRKVLPPSPTMPEELNEANLTLVVPLSFVLN